MVCYPSRWDQRRFQQRKIGFVHTMDFYTVKWCKSWNCTQVFKRFAYQFISLGFNFENCRGQGYDGASAFQGHISGVAKRFKDKNPATVSVHCLAHCVNLTLQEVTRKVTCIKEGLNFAMEAIQLIKFSPKRQVVFENIQTQQVSPHSSIRSLCPTRWTVRTGAMQVLEQCKLLWKQKHCS